MMQMGKVSIQPKARKAAQQFEDACQRINEGEITALTAQSLVSHMVEEITGERIVAPTISEYFEEWLNRKKTHKAAESTIKRYKPVLNGFRNYLGDKCDTTRLSAVSGSQMQSYYDHLLSEGFAPPTANFHINKVLRSVFNSAAKLGHIKVNPCDSVEAMDGESEERIPFTSKEINSLLSATKGDWYGAILIAAYTGMRIGDITKLTWSSYSDENKTFSFKSEKTHRRKKGKNKITTIAIHPKVVKWLKQQELGIGNKPIFESLYKRYTGSNQGLSNEFSSIMQKAGVKPELGEKKKGKGRRLNLKSFHSLRHSFISALANAEVSADIRKQLSGHSSDEVHDRYVHLELDTQRKALQKIPNITG